MSKYRLKMPVEKINFHSWRIIFNTLRGNSYYEYMMAENDEYFFDNEFNSDIMDV